MRLLAHDQRSVALHLHAGDHVRVVAVGLGAVVDRRDRPSSGRRRRPRAATRGVLAAVHLLAVGRLAQLGHDPVQGHVERGDLVGAGRLGPHHRALAPQGDLDAVRLVVLSLVPLLGHLDLDPDDPVVELFQPGELFLDQRAELVRHRAVPALHDNIHQIAPFLGVTDWRRLGGPAAERGAGHGAGRHEAPASARSDRPRGPFRAELSRGAMN